MKAAVPFLSATVVKMLLKETPPRCFHCGVDYKKDFKYCGESHNTWMPDCDCLSKTVRIVTSSEMIIDIGEDL